MAIYLVTETSICLPFKQCPIGLPRHSQNAHSWLTVHFKRLSQYLQTPVNSHFTLVRYYQPPANKGCVLTLCWMAPYSV